MTNKTTMLEPVGYFACNPETLDPEWGEDCVCQDDVYDPEVTGTVGRPFVFADQAEAYADARVREALEEVAQIADSHDAFSTYDAIRAAMEQQAAD